MTKTNIEWAQQVWNPTIGCTRVSTGCNSCYAFRVHDQRYAHNNELGKRLVGLDVILNEGVRDKGWPEIVAGMPKPEGGWAADARRRGARGLGDEKLMPRQYDTPFSQVQMFEDRLEAPLHRQKPTRYFVNSMSDLFHHRIPVAFIDSVFATMARAPQHQFLILTKRPERMFDYMVQAETRENVWLRVMPHQPGMTWPLPNVWLGVTAENQETYDQRWPLLRATPAAVRFISFEPALEAIDFGFCSGCDNDDPDDGVCNPDWVIVGGESGSHARPFDIAWARSAIAQCKAAEVPVFIKQLGSKPEDAPLLWPLRLKGHGADMAAWHPELRVREYPR